VLGFDDKPKSSVRFQVHTFLSKRTADTRQGYACFRAYFKGAYLKEDPLCREFADKECVNIWIGPDLHLVQNTLRNGEEFNWIITHKDTEDIQESWFQPGDMNEVRRLVEDIDPRIRAAVLKTESCLDWKICYRDPIPTWVSAKHTIVLLGDCCHPHLPTSAQGASQATESAAVLAQCLLLAGADKGADAADVPLATRVYEKLRFPRVRVSQTNGEDLRDRWHGALKGLDEGVDIDPETLYMRNRHLYEFDAEEDTRDKWDDVSRSVRDELKTGNVKPLFEGPWRNELDQSPVGQGPPDKNAAAPAVVVEADLLALQV